MLNLGGGELLLVLVVLAFLVGVVALGVALGVRLGRR
jgi:hypothetical protein